MAQLGGPDENGQCLSSSILTNQHSYFGDNHPVNNLISKIQTMRTKEALSSGLSLESNNAQDGGGLGQSSEPLSQIEDYR